MPPPLPLSCSVDGCTFSTPTGTPTWEVMANILSTHSQAVHGGGGPAHTNSTVPLQRLEKLPRLSFQLDMSQAEWAFKKSQWDAYISHTAVSEQVRVVHKTRHLQNMWAMVQSPEESIRAFVSRLIGTAELVTCLLPVPR